MRSSYAHECAQADERQRIYFPYSVEKGGAEKEGMGLPSQNIDGSTKREHGHVGPPECYLR
jgi:hypothetical protein